MTGSIVAPAVPNILIRSSFPVDTKPANGLSDAIIRLAAVADHARQHDDDVLRRAFAVASGGAVRSVEVSG